MPEAFRQLKREGSGDKIASLLYPFEEHGALIGFEDVTASDERKAMIAEFDHLRQDRVAWSREIMEVTQAH